jgi:hypothetical protein
MIMNKNLDGKNIESILTQHFFQYTSDENNMKEIRNKFHKYGYFCFKDFTFLPKEILGLVHSEIHNLLDTYSVRRDVQVASTANTYRKMYNVNQPEIKEKGQIIPAIYESAAVKNFLGNIARDELASCWEQEQYLITKLSNGETLKLFTDQITTPTFIDDIAVGLGIIIDKKSTGIYHLVGSSSQFSVLVLSHLYHTATVGIEDRKLRQVFNSSNLSEISSGMTYLGHNGFLASLKSAFG